MSSAHGRFADRFDITRLVIFDFDGTLFASPEKPSWWPEGKGFWGKLETLSPPLVPHAPSVEDGWWNSDLVAEAQRASASPNTMAVLMTGRIPKFRDRVKQMLESVGVHLHDHHFATRDKTLDFKLAMLEEFKAKLPNLEYVEMYDDRPEHIQPFQEKLDTLGLKHDVKLVERATREFEK